jgi:transcriptional regulator with XRE-family HTH domain
MGENDQREPQGRDLASSLRTTRELLGISLRKAAESAGLSAAYLSQLESGAARDPSPRFLFALAQLYGRDTSSTQALYTDFMRRAGYVVPRADDSAAATPTALDIALSSTPLDEEERRDLAEYLAFLRSRRRRARGSE